MGSTYNLGITTKMAEQSIDVLTKTVTARKTQVTKIFNNSTAEAEVKIQSKLWFL